MENKIYTFTMSILNGTVTIKTETYHFYSKEFAEKVRNHLIDTKSNIEDLTFLYSEIEEIEVLTEENCKLD